MARSAIWPNTCGSIISSTPSVLQDLAVLVCRSSSPVSVMILTINRRATVVFRDATIGRRPANSCISPNSNRSVGLTRVIEAIERFWLSSSEVEMKPKEWVFERILVEPDEGAAADEENLRGVRCSSRP